MWHRCNICPLQACSIALSLFLKVIWFIFYLFIFSCLVYIENCVSFNYVLYCVVWVLMFDHLCFGQHHCRNCGDIFCDKCTRGRIALTSDEDALQVRVCDRCMVCVVLVHFPLHPLPIPSTDAWFMLPLQFLRFSASWWKFQFMFFCPSWMGLLSPVSLHFSIALV